jgi:cytochrome c553
MDTTLSFRRPAVVALALTLLAGPGAATAGDVKAGRAKAKACEVCHGMDGQSKVPEAPNLAGQVENYLVAQLQAFKAGKRASELMSVIAQTLSQPDIESLAAYYAAIEVTVGKIPGD